MTALTGAKCAGLWWLFDSTDQRDHIEARKLCAECPALLACDQERQRVRESGCYAKPIGTWAGALYGKAGHERFTIAECGTEQGYQQHRYRDETACGPCKAAHAAKWRGTNHHRRKAS